MFTNLVLSFLLFSQLTNSLPIYESLSVVVGPQLLQPTKRTVKNLTLTSILDSWEATASSSSSSVTEADTKDVESSSSSSTSTSNHHLRFLFLLLLLGGVIGGLIWVVKRQYKKREHITNHQGYNNLELQNLNSNSRNYKNV